jgi:hypothetical protein
MSINKKFNTIHTQNGYIKYILTFLKIICENDKSDYKKGRRRVTRSQIKAATRCYISTHKVSTAMDHFTELV